MASRAAVWRRPTNDAPQPTPVENLRLEGRPAGNYSPSSTSSGTYSGASRAASSGAVPVRVVSAAGATRCAPRELTLSHELTVRGAALASPPYLSAWFRPPDGDPDRWWRLVVQPEKGVREGPVAWTLALQLASTEELDTLMRRRPRCLAPPAAGPAPAQTNYILRTVDAKLILNRGVLAPSLGQERFQTIRPAALLRNNFAILGLLDTLQPVSVCDLPAALLLEVCSTPGDDRALCVQVAFTVEYHESEATS